MSIAELVLQKVANLPADRQREVLAYVERLAGPAEPLGFKDPYGMLRDSASNLSLEEFQIARREMWENAPRDLPGEGQ